MIVVGVAYVIMRAVIKHERLKTNETIKSAVSLTNVISEKWKEQGSNGSVKRHFKKI